MPLPGLDPATTRPRGGALVATDLRLTFASLPSALLDGVSFRLDLGATPAPRVALCGPNGHGKTTLLRVLLGEQPVDAGTLQAPWPLARAGEHIARLDQTAAQVAPDDPSTIEDRILAGATRWRDTRSVLRELEREMARPALAAEALDALFADYTDTQARFDALGGYALELEAERVLDMLAEAGLERSRRLAELSCGERTRVALCAVVLSRPALLVLDEPTNHLDAEGIAWLQRELTDLALPVLLVSHDRALIDAVATRVWHLESGELVERPGNWSDFEAWREAQRTRQQHLHDVQQAEIGRLETTLRERMGWSHRRERDKFGHGRPVQGMVDRGHIGARAAKQARRALAVRRRIEHELDARRAEAVRLIERPRLALTPPASPVPDVVLSARRLTVRRAARCLVDGLDLDLRAGDRVALVGPNGSGKTTLLEVLAGVRSPDTGELQIAGRVERHLQRQQPLPGARDETVCGALDGQAHDESIRAVLGALGLSGDLADRSLDVLSPGQRARVELARTARSGAALLLLDEPTNHLDAATIEALEQALADWPGALVVASHDRRFIEAIGAHSLPLTP